MTWTTGLPKCPVSPEDRGEDMDDRHCEFCHIPMAASACCDSKFESKGCPHMGTAPSREPDAVREARFFIDHGVIPLANQPSDGDDEIQSSDEVGSPVHQKTTRDPAPLSLQQGLDTTTTTGTVGNDAAKVRDGGNVANPERKPAQGPLPSSPASSEAKAGHEVRAIEKWANRPACSFGEMEPPGDERALDGRSYDAGLEAAAQLCEKPVGIGHPKKVAGVCIGTEPPAPHHAQVIRSLKGDPPPPQLRQTKAPGDERARVVERLPATNQAEANPVTVATLAQFLHDYQPLMLGGRSQPLSVYLEFSRLILSEFNIYRKAALSPTDAPAAEGER